jgi:hypothetical protein
MNLILDENIIELGARVRDRTGADCGTLMGIVLSRCETLHCNSKLLNSYLHRLKLLKDRSPSADYIAKMLNFIRTKGSIRICEFAPTLSREELIPEDDIFLIRLAVHTRSTLISTDLRLKKALVENGLLSMYGIEFKTPIELLNHYEIFK